MTSERTSEPCRVEAAIDAVLGELTSVNHWLNELDNEVRIGLNRREKLVKAADGLIQTLNREDKPPFRKRFVRTCMRVKPKAVRQQTTLTDVIAFLADRDVPTVTPQDVRAYLASTGRAKPEKYAVNALLRLEKSGAVSRIGYGSYRINRQSPEVLGAQMTIAKRIEAGLAQPGLDT